MNQKDQVSASASGDREIIGEVATLLLACADAQDETTIGQLIENMVLDPISAGQVCATLYQMCEAHIGAEAARKAAKQTAAFLVEGYAGDEGRELAAGLLRLLAAKRIGAFSRAWPLGSQELPMVISYFLGFAHGVLAKKESTDE